MGKLSALKEGIEKAAKALDMSQAARMQRAAEQGFDTGKPLYHGTPEDFEKFKEAYGGTYFAEDPAVSEFFASRAGNYYGAKKFFSRAENVFDATKPGADEVLRKIEEKHRLSSSLVDPDDGEYMPLDRWVKSGHLFKLGRDVQNDVMEALSDEGYDAVRYIDASPATGDSISFVVFDPSKIRSADAAFDPAQKESSNLLAQFAPIATGTGLAALGLSPDETQAAINSYIQATQGSNPILDNLNRNLQPVGMNQQGVPVTGTMQATPHPLLGQIADVVRTPQAPGLGPLFGGAADYLDKLAQGQKTTYFDRLGAALDVIP